MVAKSRNGNQQEALHADLSELYARVGTLEQAVASANTSLQNIASTVQQIVERVNQPAPATNWIGIGSLVIATVLAGWTYVQTRMTPIEEAHKAVLAEMAVMRASQFDFAGQLGYQRAKQEDLAREFEGMKNHEPSCRP